MKHQEYLCQSKLAARRNRERVASHENILGYLEQESLREHWIFGEEKPHSILVDELPTVHQKSYHTQFPDRLSDEVILVASEVYLIANGRYDGEVTDDQRLWAMIA